MRFSYLYQCTFQCTLLVARFCLTDTIVPPSYKFTFSNRRTLIILQNKLFIEETRVEFYFPSIENGNLCFCDYFSSILYLTFYRSCIQVTNYQIIENVFLRICSLYMTIRTSLKQTYQTFHKITSENILNHSRGKIVQKHGPSTQKSLWYLEIYRTAQNTRYQY